MVIYNREGCLAQWHLPVLSLLARCYIYLPNYLLFHNIFHLAEGDIESWWGLNFWGGKTKMGSVCSSIECPPSIQTYKFPGILIFYFVATMAHITMVDLCPLPHWPLFWLVLFFPWPNKLPCVGKEIIFHLCYSCSTEEHELWYRYSSTLALIESVIGWKCSTSVMVSLYLHQLIAMIFYKFLITHIHWSYFS